MQNTAPDQPSTLAALEAESVAALHAWQTGLAERVRDAQHAAVAEAVATVQRAAADPAYLCATLDGYRAQGRTHTAELLLSAVGSIR